MVSAPIVKNIEKNELPCISTSNYNLLNNFPTGI